MTYLAVLATGLAVYLAAGLAVGRPVPFSRRRRRPATSRARTWLLQAGVDLTPRQFWLGSIGAAAGAFLVLVLVTATPMVAAVPAVTVGALPRAYFARRRSRRLRVLQEAWPDGIRDLLAAITAGTSLHQAVCGLARDGPEPLRDAFARYPTLARMIGVGPALEAIKEELADPTSDRIIEILILAHDRGGHILSEILRDLADATTRDVRTLEEIETDSLEQRINARAVFVLPWLVLLALTMQDGFFRDFYRSASGAVVVVVAGVFSLAGIAIVGRLARQPIEPRVLGAAARPSPRQGEAP